MPGFGDGQIEEFQRPQESQATVFGIVLVEAIEGSFDLVPDIRVEIFNRAGSPGRAGAHRDRRAEREKKAVPEGGQSL